MNERSTARKRGEAAPTPDKRRAGPSRGVAQESLRGLVRVDGLMRRLSERHFSRLGLSPAQWGVLRSLMRLEEQGRHEPRMNELGAALLVRPPSLSATLDRMVRAGWVRRRHNPEDRRSRLIGLSPRGRELLRLGLRDHASWVEKVMGGLEEAEQEQLLDLLLKLSRHLDALADSLPAHGQHEQTSEHRRRQRTQA